MKKKRLKRLRSSASAPLDGCAVSGHVKAASQAGEKPPVPVKVAAVELNSAGGGGARYSATIIPRTEVELAFKVGGYVDALQQVRGVDGRMRDLQEGDRITAGAVLARVRQSDYQVKVREAVSQADEAKSGVDASKAQYQEALNGIASSKAQLAEAEAAYEKAKLDFDRAQNLFASQSMTKANYDAAKAQYDMTAAKVAAARSQVRMLQAKADAAKCADRSRRGQVERGAGGRAGDDDSPPGHRTQGAARRGRAGKIGRERDAGLARHDRIRRRRHVVGQSGLRRRGRRRAGNETGKDAERRDRDHARHGISRTDHLRLSRRRPQEPSLQRRGDDPEPGLSAAAEHDRLAQGGEQARPRRRSRSCR